MINSVLFVTAFKDINRGSWPYLFPRTTDAYIEQFKQLIKTPINLICFCEESIKERLLELGFKNCYPYDEKNTFFRYLDKEKTIMESQDYRKLAEGRNVGECNVPEYNIVNHNKVIFISRAKEFFPEYTHYGWIDFGYMRTTQEFRNFEWPLNDFIVYPGFPVPLYIPDPRENVKQDVIFIQGSIFIVPTKLVEWFFVEYTNTLKWFHELNVVDDDQAIVQQIYKNHLVINF